ncbi:hypothetical protein SAMN05421770_10329 [Granulicella rosea]|uniref:Uncharacterized protein n=1 Tax=Granulicella rosea TaxID=474952 RepID=A0A239ICJ6_9BACT|nr:hypothetical protein [Granulicella rosea]SNS90773.1 hypothetical protein SAMN05421770_10329 [Granulicella rosea]
MELSIERGLVAGLVTEYKNPSGPRVFAAPLNHETRRERFIASLVQSPLAIVWSSIRGGGYWESDAGGQDRRTTLLTAETQPLLLADLADTSADDVGRRYEIAAVLRGENLPDVDIGLYMSLSVQTFLREGSGMEWLIHQPNDSLDYVFVSRSPSSATVQLLGGEWGLFDHAKLERAPIWLRSTQRYGELPP